MSSKIKLNNNQGDTITLEHSDTISSLGSRVIPLDNITHKVSTIAELRAMTERPEFVYVEAYDDSGSTYGAFGSHFFKRSSVVVADNGGTVIQSVNDTYELQYSGAVNARWFNTLQAAVDMNTTVIIDKPYTITSQINVDESYLVFTPEGSITSSTVNAVLYYTATSTKKRCGGEGIRLYGTGASTTGIIIDGRKNLIFEDVGIYNMGGDGFEFRDQNGFIENIVINKMEIDTIGRHGMFINKYNNSNFINEVTITALEIRQAGTIVGSGNEIHAYNAGASGSTSKISGFTFLHGNFDIRSADDNNPRDVEREANGVDIVKFSSAGGVIEHFNFYDCTFENTKLNDTTTQFALNFALGASRIKVIAPIMSVIKNYRNEANTPSLYFETPDKQVVSTKAIYNKYIGDGSFLQMTDTDINPTNSSLWDIDIRRSNDHARIGLAGGATKAAGIFFDTDNRDFGGNYAYIQKAATNGDLDIAQATTGNINLKCYGNIKMAVSSNGVGTMITTFPTADPLVVGQLWNNNGVVTVSAG